MRKREKDTGIKRVRCKVRGKDKESERKRESMSKRCREKKIKTWERENKIE